jgi:hypothetical protein
VCSKEIIGNYQCRACTNKAQSTNQSTKHGVSSKKIGCRRVDSALPYCMDIPDFRERHEDICAARHFGTSPFGLHVMANTPPNQTCQCAAFAAIHHYFATITVPPATLERTINTIDKCTNRTRRGIHVCM